MEKPYKHVHRDLVEGCLAGNRQAQFKLYKLYSKAMYNTVLRMVRNPHDAEDLLQAAFVDIFTKMNSFRYECTIGAWMKRVVINKTINFLKSRRMHFTELSASESENMVDERDCQDMTYVQFSVQNVTKAIEALPDGYRTVFSLYALEGYDHEEIGSILGISASTSKSQYSRAKAKIRSIIAEEKQ